MAHSTPNNPMAKPILIGSLALIGAAVFVLVSSLFGTIGKNSIKGAEDTTMQAAAADANLAPIGSVNKVDKSVVKAAPAADTKPAETAAPAADAKPAETAAPAAVAPAADAKPAEAAAPAAAADGEKVYKATCFACHDVGVAGAPKLDDKAAWAARIATGNDALYGSAIKGKNAMPPKGGNPSLADADVKAAVDFMMGKAK